MSSKLVLLLHFVYYYICWILHFVLCVWHILYFVFFVLYLIAHCWVGGGDLAAMVFCVFLVYFTFCEAKGTIICCICYYMLYFAFCVVHSASFVFCILYLAFCIFLFWIYILEIYNLSKIEIYIFWQIVYFYSLWWCGLLMVACPPGTTSWMDGSPAKDANFLSQKIFFFCLVRFLKFWNIWKIIIYIDSPRV